MATPYCVYTFELSMCNVLVFRDSLKIKIFQIKNKNKKYLKTTSLDRTDSLTKLVYMYMYMYNVGIYNKLIDYHSVWKECHFFLTNKALFVGYHPQKKTIDIIYTESRKPETGKKILKIINLYLNR
jgi:hypothetical protein